MKKKSRITAILLSVVMIFAMAPLTAGVVFANGDGGDGNEGEGGTTDPVKTVILEPGTIGGDPVEVHSNDPGAMAESEETAANGQFFVHEGAICYKLPDLPYSFVGTAGVEFKGWVINHSIVPFFNPLSPSGYPIGFQQGAETMTVTALWGPKGANIDPLAGLTFMYYDEEETATVIGYDTNDPDDIRKSAQTPIGFSVQKQNITRATNMEAVKHYNFGVWAWKVEGRNGLTDAEIMNNNLVGYSDGVSKGYDNTNASTWASSSGTVYDQKSPWFYEKLGNTEYTYTGDAGFYTASQTAFMSANAIQFLRYWDQNYVKTNFYCYTPYDADVTFTKDATTSTMTFGGANTIRDGYEEPVNTA